MAVSVIFTFPALEGRDPRDLYDAVVDEMGIRDNPAPGAVYHWCAESAGGLIVCDVWESQSTFEAFAQTKIVPLAAKHGLSRPQIQTTPVHESIRGPVQAETGTGIVLEFDGDPDALLRSVDEINRAMNVRANPPAGLAFHWSTGIAGGLRVYDHWASREDFEHFAATRLGNAMQSVNAPVPRITFYEIHNVLDPLAARTKVS